MAIYDHKYGDLPYYRVFRAWGGKEYQEYVRIKRSKKAAYAKAKEIDDRLAERQKAFFLKQAYTPEFHMRKDGRIRGVRRVTVNRKGRKPTEVFELRINIPWETSIRRTTISIDVHGLDKAFKMSVDKVCEWYGLDGLSDARSSMLAALPTYSQQEGVEAEKKAEPEKKPENKQEKKVEAPIEKKVKDELSSIKDGLFNAIKKFRE